MKLTPKEARDLARSHYHNHRVCCFGAARGNEVKADPKRNAHRQRGLVARLKAFAKKAKPCGNCAVTNPNGECCHELAKEAGETERGP